MPFQKFKASHLFTGTDMLDENAVLIINTDGTIEDIAQAGDAGDDIRQLNGILSPGFINCHCHLELSHMKGLVPEHTGLVDFVFKVVTQRHFADEEILDAIARAEDEMMAGGIVAVGDICNNTLTLEQKQLQRLFYYNFIEVSGWHPDVAQMRFDRSLSHHHAYASLGTTTGMRSAITPHAPYSVSAALWEMMMPHFHHHTITIHNQETSAENELFLRGTGDFQRMYRMMNIDNSFFQPTGKSSLQSYFHQLSRAEQVLLVHNSYSSAEDMAFVNKHSLPVNWCLCINANQYIEQAIPPVDLLRSHRASIVLGTDSLASNHSLSILDELKTISRFFPHIPIAELLQWATLNGARALQMDEQLGSFEKGKRSGVLCIQHTEAGINDETIVERLI